MEEVKTQVWFDGGCSWCWKLPIEFKCFIETNKNKNINGEKEMKVSHVNYIKGDRWWVNLMELPLCNLQMMS